MLIGQDMLISKSDCNLMPLGGMVLRENYEQDLQANNNLGEIFAEMAESESQGVLYSQI
jgi:hypothetical protein